MHSLKNILYSSLFILHSTLIVLLASCNADTFEKKGDKSLALGEYYLAADYYRQAYSRTPNNERTKRGERALKMASCYARYNHAQKAVGAYRNAVRYKVADQDAMLSYGRQLLKVGDYKTALKVFTELKDSMPDNVLVSNGLKSATLAPEWKKQGSDYTVKRMDVFNSRRDDYSPCLGGEDFDHLYFSSTRNDAEGDDLNGITGTKSSDIFFSQKDDKGKWSKPETVSGGLNSEYDEGACFITPDGSEMYLTLCAEDGSYPRYAKVVKSSRSDASWGKPQDVVISRDSLSTFAHPAISPDGAWLYFVSDMPGTKGGMDIWRSRITSSGLMGVENLGEPVNTPGNEMFPTFRSNGDFYFSSDGHPGMGGLDIFIARIGSDHKYHIENLGYPMNTQADDFGMTFEGAHNHGFFSSSRNDGRGYDHIYYFENPEIVQLIKGWVYEADGYELNAAEVRLVGSDGTNKRISVKSDGSFEQVVKPGVDYVMLATCRGFLNKKEELSVPKATKSETYTLQFPLSSINAPVLIDNIFYEFDKATLLRQSTKALDSLVLLLNDNPNITIELAAHTDSKGSDAYNKALSQRRAEQVVKYLVSKGIAPERLTPVGYGEERPKKIRRKVAERYPWLKDGDVLTEEFISKLKPDEQATADALNRRTEFTVLRTTYNMFDENGNLKNPPKPRKPQTDDSAGDDGFYFDF